MSEVTEPVVEPVEEPVEEVATSEPAPAEPIAETAPPVSEPPAELVETVEEGIFNTPILSSEQGKEIDKDIEELFKVVSEKIRLSVASGELSPDSFQTILLKVVETIEELSDNNVSKLSGTEKRAIALNVTKLIIEDLHEHGHLSDDVYGWLHLGITFLAPALFSGAKALYNKIQDVAEDIQEHGRAGCFYRNCLKK